MKLRGAVVLTGLLLAAVLVVLGLGVVVGAIGVPQVDSVQNSFGGVNESTTVVDSTVTVSNPNPIGISLGGVAIDYTITMNDVEMGSGHKRGISLDAGTTDVPLTTVIDNDDIPAWWVTHVRNGERTELVVSADVSHRIVGKSLSVPEKRTIRTDILGQFNDSETRAIDANVRFVEDPVLYVNETSAYWGTNVTRDQTPMTLDVDVYNPKSAPYAITEIGYAIEMNGVPVGAGSTSQSYVLPANSRETLQTRARIDNSRLDEWWVRHLERNQTTDLYVDFYVVVEPPDRLGQHQDPIRIDNERLDYETTFQTDLFGAGNTTVRSGNGFSDDVAPEAATGLGTYSRDDRTKIRSQSVFAQSM